MRSSLWRSRAWGKKGCILRKRRTRMREAQRASAFPHGTLPLHNSNTTAMRMNDFWSHVPGAIRMEMTGRQLGAGGRKTRCVAVFGSVAHGVVSKGIYPQKRHTRTRDAQRARRLMWAAGGATRVPKDQKATPAMRTIVPPILQHTQFRSSAQPGGATRVPKDQKAMPAMRTIEPPILQHTQPTSSAWPALEQSMHCQ